jgi:hypothetical protein
MREGDTDPITLLDLAIKTLLVDCAEMEYSTFQGVAENCNQLREHLLADRGLDEHLQALFSRLVQQHIGELTYQLISSGGEPELPYSDLGDRLQKAGILLDFYADKGSGPQAGEVVERCEKLIRDAKHARFHYAWGEPFDLEDRRRKEALARGKVVELPPGRSIRINVGPAFWSSDMALDGPWGTFIRVGQTRGATVLMLVEMERDFPYPMRLFQVSNGRQIEITPLEKGQFWIADDLHDPTGSKSLSGTHFALHRESRIIVVLNLGSPLGVFVQKREYYDGTTVVRK